MLLDVLLICSWCGRGELMQREEALSMREDKARISEQALI
jgi:hypothetical protein